MPADPSALSTEDSARLAALVADVLAAEWPRVHLQTLLDALEIEQKPALAAALFESVVYRIDVRDYWLYFRVWRIYRALGPSRQDAAYFAAAMAVQLGPAWSGSGQAFGFLFQTLRRRGFEPGAVDLFRYQMEYTPEVPCAEPHDILPMLKRHGGPMAEPKRPSTAPDVRINHPVLDPDTRPAWTCPGFGGMPYSLLPLAEPMKRPGIRVAELLDAEVLIAQNSVIVIDRNGDLHPDLSVCQFPEQVRRKLDRLAQAGSPVEMHQAEEAVVISDRFPAPNLCHLLFDQISRLWLYKQVGVDPARVLVIGPEPHKPFQKQILRRAGVTESFGTDGMARLKVTRLWVSTNCVDFRHAGHIGSRWAVDFARKTLGGQGGKGWRRLYISRADVPFRRVVNEAEVIAMLEPHGFDVIVPGTMPYEAQIAAFKQASHVIGAHGAGLAHIVMCPEEAHVLEIFHPLYGTAAYAMQAEPAGLNYAAMVARDAQSDAPEWNDPAVTDVTASDFLERHLRVDLNLLARYLLTVV